MIVGAVAVGSQQSESTFLDQRWWLVPNVIYFDDTLAQWVMMVATIVAAVIVYRTFKTTQLMAVDAQRIGDAQTRAYLWTDGCSIKDVQIGGRPSVQVVIRNYGNTPALVLEHRAYIGLYHFPNFGDLLEPVTEPSGPFVIGPNGTTASNPQLEDALSQELLDGLIEGRLIIFCYGVLRYTDVYGETHQIQYRQQFGGDTGTDFSTLAWSKDGNDASYLQARNK